MILTKLERIDTVVEADNRQFIIGIDLSNDYTQVASFDAHMEEPESMSVIKDEKRFLIPTVLCKNIEGNGWSVGDEAVLREKRGEGEAVRDILDITRDENTIVLLNEVYSAEEILNRYMLALLDNIKNYYQTSVINQITVTIDDPDKDIIDKLYKTLNILGFNKEDVRVIGHSESFIYYTINQNKALWVNDVAVFDFSKEGFIYRRLHLARGRVPKIISVYEEDLSETFDYFLLDSDSGKEKLDAKFTELVLSDFKKHIVSSVFLTGTGFYEKWMNQSLEVICNKRRVFQGHNLFVKGACYAGKKKFRKTQLDEYLFDCVGRTKVNIGVLIEHEGRNMQLLLSKAGLNWYEAGADTDCILDDVNSIQFVLTSPLTKISRNVSIDLSTFPERPNKTTRVGVVVSYKDEMHCTIMIKDKGFGEFFESSGMTIKKNIELEEWI